MEIRSAKRSLLQTTYSPIVYRREPGGAPFGVPEIADPGRPAAEAAARLRVAAVSDDLVEQAMRAATDERERALLSAIRAGDSLALIAAVNEHGGQSDVVVDKVIEDLVRLQLNAVTAAVEALTRGVDALEDALVTAHADDLLSTLSADAERDAELLRRAGRLVAAAGGTAATKPREDAAGGIGESAPSSRDSSDSAGAEPSPEIRLPEAALRRGALARAREMSFPAVTSLSARIARTTAATAARRMPMAPLIESMAKVGVTDVTQLDTALSAWNHWAQQIRANTRHVVPLRPFGYLHLERLDFIPAGVEHGELVYSLPLTPGEEVEIVHKEWSNTSEEFAKLVSDQFEDYSEKGVVESTDLSSSSSAQSSHGSKFSVSVGASGGLGPISGSVSTSYGAQASDSASRETSAHSASTVTKKASSRSRREHRISFRLAKRTGVEDQSVRKIRNPDPLHPVRFDYYQLLRKWRVDLRRYGIRLTYDLTIPEPAIDLLERYQELDKLEAEIEQGFEFYLQAEDITYETWAYYAGKYGAVVEPPPRLYRAVQGTKVGGPWGPGEAHVDMITVTCPDGYSWYDVSPPMILRCIPAQEDEVFAGGATDLYSLSMNPMNSEVTFGILQNGATEQLVSIRVFFMVEDSTYEAWQIKAHHALREAASRAYFDRRQSLQERRERLLAEANGEDALTLRKLEREELMKNVLRWLFGPSFKFAPPGAIAGYFDATGAVTSSTAAGALNHGRLVSFLHQALEWENLNSFLYPYFWTPRTRWKRRLSIRHDDPIHEAFLRAGAARVVIPIRRGWENAFLALLSTGTISSVNHPYQTIAEEIENYANTNYPGIVPANPADIDPEEATQAAEGNLVASWYEYTPTSALDLKIGAMAPVEGEFMSSGFAPASPPQPWWLDPAVGQAAADVLAGVAARLAPGDDD